MTKNISSKKATHSTRLKKALASVGLVPALIVGLTNSAAATSTYAVPVSGLSFNANDTVQLNPCSDTSLYGNGASWAATDEINGLIAGEFVTYENVATIGGQAIDAKVTLTSVSGMDSETSRSNAVILDRLDKCYASADPDMGLMELRFDSDTATPGEAYFVLTVDFLAGGTPATLTGLKMNVEDIDSNQYLEVDNFTSVRLAAGRASDDVQEYENGEVIQLGGSNTTTLTTSSSARRFHATGSSSSSDAQGEQDKHVAEVSYSSVSSLVIRLGVYETGGGSFDLNFTGFNFVSEPEVISAAPTPSPTPTPAPAATLATTGVSDPLAVGILGSTAAILIGLGAFLSRMRRRLS